MINKENDKEIESEKKDDSFMDVQCHILIKDNETGEVLVNKRG